MSAVRILAPGESLIDEIVKELVQRHAAAQQDLSNDLVVFPGKRPAHSLRKALAERIGTSFLPPQIYSIDTFIEFLYRKRLKLDWPQLSSFDAVAILFDLHGRFARRLGSEAYRSLESFLPMGMKLVGELEEVMMAHQSERSIREALGSFQFQKVESFREYYEGFYNEVERRGFVTRAMMYRTVAERIREVDWSVYRSVILAGFYALTHSEKIIFAHLKEQENVTLLFQHGVGLKQQLLSLGISEEYELSSPRIPEVQFITAPDVHGQVVALAAQLKKQLMVEGTLDERTAVVLPSSEALFPVLHGALSVLPEDSYNIALQYPLSRTPVYGFLQRLADCIASSHNGKFSASAYLKFVLHPYTKNIRLGNRTEATRVFFHAVEDHFVEHYAKVLFRLEELEQDEQLFTSVERQLAHSRRAQADAADLSEAPTRDELRTHLVTIHNNTIRKFLGVQTVGQLAARAMEVLDYIFAHSTANLHPYVRPYVLRLMEVLDEIRSSLLANLPLSDEVAAFQLLRTCLAQETIPFPGTPLKGLQVLGLLETRNLAFETLYILDATDDVIPRRPVQDMLLPQPVRQSLGLETYHDAERLIEYYVDLAVRSAKRVVLFYSESEEREKSRYVQKLLWQRQQEAGGRELQQIEQSVHYRVRLEVDWPEPVHKTPEMVAMLRNDFTFSASALDLYLACPLKFYYQHVLRLREREEVQDAVEASDVGELVHRILARYVEPLVGQRLTTDNLSVGHLEQVITACFEETFGRDATGMVLLLRRQVQDQLRRFLIDYQQRLVEREEVVVESVEQRIEVEYHGYRFTGRIDRVERRGTRIHIIDYKTGAEESKMSIRLDKLDLNDPETWGKAIPSFQLPVYMLLYSRGAQTELSSLVPQYLFLGKQTMGEEIEHGLGEDGQSPAEVLAMIEPVMLKVIENVLDPDVPFRPTREFEKHCPHCPFNTICGTQWVKGWEAG